MISYSPTMLAGDIPGVPITQPPSLHQDFQIQLSNDFFTLFTNADDFRTQQITLSTYVSDDWLVVLDQSLLTLRGPQHDLPDPPGMEGRLDQLSASLAYRTYYYKNANNIDQLLFGAGLRAYGNFEGARIQSGVHRMLNNDLVNLPYVATERTDALIWLRASRQRYFSTTSVELNSANWRFGYWLDTTALQTSDGQFDATLGGYGLIRYRDLDIWYGLRGDWREGYNRDIVQHSVAEQERGVSLALGIAYGPLRLESIEGIGDNRNSYGRLVLSAQSDLTLAPDLKGPTIAYQFGLLSPEVAVQNQLRWSPQQTQNLYRYSLVFDHRYGTAALNDRATQFNMSNQLIVGMETAFSGQAQQDWLQPYAMLGAGYRSEYIEGQDVLLGQQSEKVSSAVIVADTGIRLHLSGKKNNWRLQFLLGITGWIPLQSKDVSFNGEQLRILQSDLSWISGINMVWRY